jgi:NAD(P)-dependent dehydrogenase (short-subunit alcohol dehydrogenase family)
LDFPIKDESMTKRMTIDFSGKVAIVTGGASGMGAAAARLITESGGRVVIADIDATAGTAHAAELGTSARFVRTDVTSVDDTKRLMAATIEAFGRIDVLFNNAGKGSLGDAATLEPADWYQIIDVNLNSAYLMTKAALPHLKAAGGGSIVNTASVSGLAGDYGMVASRDLERPHPDTADGIRDRSRTRHGIRRVGSCRVHDRISDRGRRRPHGSYRHAHAR